ncbi:MAG: hypothetical protein ABSF74_02105 [Dehalococcoidia bacterium]
MRENVVDRRLSVIFILVLMTIVSIAAGCVDVNYPVKETYWENATVSENHSETYSDVIPVMRTISGEQLLTPYIVWSNPELGFNKLIHLWYYGYSLPKHDESRVKILFLKPSYYEFVRVYVYDFGERGQILPPPLISAAENVSYAAARLQGIGSWNNWVNSADTKFTFARPLVGISDLWLNYEDNRIIEFDTHGSREIAIVINGPAVAQNCHFTATLTWSDNETENVTRTSDHLVTSNIQQPTEKTRTTFKTMQVPFWEMFFNR